MQTTSCFILPQVEIGFGQGCFVKLRGIILCQLCVEARVFSEGKGMELLESKGSDFLFKFVEVLSVATSPQMPENVAWHSLLLLPSHYQGDE